MERWLREPSLSSPVLAFTGEQAVAENHLHPVVASALDVALLFLNEHVVDVVHSVDENELMRTETEANEVTEITRTLAEQLDGVSPRVEHMAEKRQAGWSRRVAKRARTGCGAGGKRN